MTAALALGLGVAAVMGPLTISAASAADEAAPAKKPSSEAVAVDFEKPGEPVELKGTLSGYEVRYYRVNAHNGQILSVDLTTSNEMIYFNVSSPDGGVFFGGETAKDHKHFSGKVTADGDYVIEVYLVRARAQQVKDAPYKLSVALKS